MKTMKINLFLALAAVALSACNNDDVKPAQEANALPTEMATVSFNMKAAALTTPRLKSMAQKYNPADLRILAFRKNNDNNYLYVKEIDNTKLTFDEGSGVFSGSDEVPVGDYYFIPAFGMPATGGTDVSTPNFIPTTNITNELNITHNNGVLPAIFLQEEGTTPTNYNLGEANNGPTTVQLKLQRAIARVDVIFVRGQKDGNGNYVEEPSDISVFGDTTKLASMTMSFTDINPTVKVMDGAIVDIPAESAIQPNFTIDLSKARTDGENATATTLATEGGNKDFENILPADIVKGGTHIYGPFVFPYKDNTQTTNLTINLTSEPTPNANHVLHRTITVKDVKLLRNQVTLVKVFVPGGDIFQNNNTFNVTINRDWDYNTDSWGEAL